MRRSPFEARPDIGHHSRRAWRGRGRARLYRRGARGSGRPDRRHDRRGRPVRRRIPCRSLPRPPASGLPRNRRDCSGRGHLAFRCTARGGPQGARGPMRNVRRLAVYCGSASGSSGVFADATRATAEVMVRRGVDLVYGGGRLGLMGLIADSVLAGGGQVFGVIPQALVDIEVAHLGLTELHTVANMHERKAKMTDLADAFLALPGGIGTLDELFEAWSWNALGYHKKPFCLLNVEGFWDGLIEFVDHATESGFLSQKRRAQLLVATAPEEALELLDEAAAAATQGMVW